MHSVSDAGRSQARVRPEDLDLSKLPLGQPCVARTATDPYFRADRTRHQFSQRVDKTCREAPYYTRILTSGKPRTAPLPPAPTTERGRALLAALSAAGSESLSGSQAAAAAQTKWLDTSALVLRFAGYWREDLPGSLTEPFRIHHATLAFFPADDTISAATPRIPNSGIVGGPILARQRLLRPPSSPSVSAVGTPLPAHLTLDDFYVGAVVPLPGRNVVIFDAADATRQFFEEIGSPLAPALPVPSDGFVPSAADASRALGPRSPLHGYPPPPPPSASTSEEGYTSWQAVWDDRGRFGDVRVFEVRHWAHDGSSAVQEMALTHAAAAPPRAFLRRCVVPGLTAASFAIGAVVDIYGRRMRIVGCAPAVRAAMAAAGRAMPPDIPQAEWVAGWPAAELPPAACGESLVARCPRVRVSAYDGVVLRFRAIARGDPPGLRAFVLAYHVATGKCAAFELPARNSGYDGGRLAAPARVPLAADGTPLEWFHLCVGASVVLGATVYTVVAMDSTARAFRYRRAHLPPAVARDGAIAAAVARGGCSEATACEAAAAAIAAVEDATAEEAAVARCLEQFAKDWAPAGRAVTVADLLAALDE